MGTRSRLGIGVGVSVPVPMACTSWGDDSGGPVTVTDKIILVIFGMV